MTKDFILAEIKTLFLSKGHDSYFGEEVSQFQHAAQALYLAQKDGEDIQMQTAAFLHDIGHLLAEGKSKMPQRFGHSEHEWVASEWLRKRSFPERIIKAVENHVASKKYLCFKDLKYYHKLSDASKATLLFQGGIMSPTEAAEFETKTFFKEMITLRKLDDSAKEIDAETPELDECLKIVELCLKGEI